MRRLKVQITEVAHRVPGKQSPVVAVIVLVLVSLLLLPILIPILVVALLFKLFSKNDPHLPADYWTNISTPSGLKLSFRWLAKEEVPDFLFKSEEVFAQMVFRSDPVLPFFSGYFTDFKIERTDGIFVQKVIPDESGRAIRAMPLYFFNYQTGETEEIRDLKGYELHARGGSDDFVIEASSPQGDLEIRLTR